VAAVSGRFVWRLVLFREGMVKWRRAQRRVDRAAEAMGLHLKRRMNILFDIVRGQVRAPTFVDP